MTLTATEAVDRLTAIAENRGVKLNDLIGACLRPLIKAGPGCKIVGADINAIEARLLAFFAGQDDLVELFRSGADVYRKFASDYLYDGAPEELTKAQRGIGKIAILSGGYNAGADTFGAMAISQGVDLAAQGFEAIDVVEAYRDSVPEIAGVQRLDQSGVPMSFKPKDKSYAIKLREGGIWKKLDAAARRVVAGQGPETLGAGFEVTLRMHGADLLLDLPSGRPIVYPSIRMEDVVPSWGGEAKPTVVYTRRGGKIPMYGGLWTENIIQAVAWDILRDSIVDLEAAGVPIILHVHDELVAEVAEGGPQSTCPSAVCDMITCRLSVAPDWVEGLPLAAEGQVTNYFCKDPVKGSYVVAFRDGELVT